MKIVKRDGTIVDYNSEKISIAIGKANNEVKPKERATKEQIKDIIDYVEGLGKKRMLVEDIQDIIEEKLMEFDKYALAKEYITYRYKRDLVRKSNTTDQTIKELLEGDSEYWNNENSNKDAKAVTVLRDYIAGVTSTDITRRFLLPEDVVKAHDEGIIHFHDADYFAQPIHNCELINLEDMLQNGTNINGVMIEKPHKFITACTIATQIILGVSSSSYGGATVSLTHLAPFVRDSYNRYYEEVSKEFESIHILGDLSNEEYENKIKEIAMQRTRKEVEAGVQTFNYQVNSMTNTNGQAPFLSVCMYLGETDEYKEELAMIIEEFLKQRILGFKNKKGVYVTPAFPKLLYVLEEDNIHEDSKYWYLTELAAKCTAKRLVPDYISEKVMKENKINQYGDGDCYPCMGCRSFLTPWTVEGNPSNALNYKEGKGKYYGRFNQGVVTINLPDVGLSANKDIDKFWEILDERLEICHKALQCRHNRLKNVQAKRAPLLWQYGALARLDKDDTIEPLLLNNYSTLSLGYAGLYECVKAMTGKSHTDPEGKEFGLKIMQHLNDKCAEWKQAESIGYSLYGTPIESTTYKFAKCLKQRFGEDVFEKLDGKDRNYITNSYHVPVFEEIDAFEKLSIESEFQRLSPGGAISYVETPNLQNNTEAILEVMKFIYDNIMYAELNTKSDYCQKCGYDGEILIDENLEWYCPNCGNRDHDTLNVARRTCGYIGSNFWNKGRTQEIKERVLHLDNKDA